MPFDGETYDRAIDGPRLKGQLDRVRAYMRAHSWVTLEDLQRACGGSQAALSARVRDLRKAKFGGFDVERRRRSDGLWEYRIAPPEEPVQAEMGL